MESALKRLPRHQADLSSLGISEQMKKVIACKISWSLDITINVKGSQYGDSQVSGFPSHSNGVPRLKIPISLNDTRSLDSYNY